MPRRTALVLLAPRADVALHDLRVRYFRNLPRRMTAHITMLFPFRPVVDDDRAADIAAIAASLRPFTATFGAVGRFGDRVVWLRPEPVDLFAAASDAVLAAFPGSLPYGGAHARSILHLTVASGLRGAQADQLIGELIGVGADAPNPVLPISEPIERISLLTEHDQGWRLAGEWPLGAAICRSGRAGVPPDGAGIPSSTAAGKDDQPADTATAAEPSRPSPNERST